LSRGTIVRGSHDATMQRGRTDAFDLGQQQARPHPWTCRTL
jgi:hypothetical protein